MKSALFMAAAIVFAAPALAQKPETPLSATLLREALRRPPRGKGAERLAERVRFLFGGAEGIKSGTSVRVSENREAFDIAFAIETPGAVVAPKLVWETKSPDVNLKRLDKTDVYAAVITQPEGFAGRFHYEVDGKRTPSRQFEVYRVHPDSKEQPNVPKGVVTQMPTWNSKIFEGTRRDWWVYVPAQYRPETPASVMVFQDGGSYRGFVPTVFDNLIAKGDMPVTIGVFVNPGNFADGRSNRSFEYDTLSDQYVRMLLDEILPEVEKTYKLSHDASDRAICGASSGGICAFTAAWERPKAFGRVISWIGSFTGIATRLDAEGKLARPGGNNYPVLIRKTPRKDIRVYLQDGENDLDNEHGSWPLANHEMARALAYKGYDFAFTMGNGFHSYDHGRAILPDSLRWVWKGFQKR